MENKQAFGSTAIKGIKPFNFRDSVNLKLSMHLVNIYEYLNVVW